MRWRLLKEYVKTNNAQTVRRNWTAKYGTPAPSRKSIYRIRDKFNATGSILNVKSPGRPKSVNTEQNQELVVQAVVESPHKSSVRISLELGLSKSSVKRIFKTIGWKPYRPQLVYGLLSKDPNLRLQMCINCEGLQFEHHFATCLLFYDLISFYEEDCF